MENSYLNLQDYGQAYKEEKGRIPLQYSPQFDLREDFLQYMCISVNKNKCNTA